MGNARVTAEELEFIAEAPDSSARVTEIEIEFAAEAADCSARVTEIEMEWIASAPPEPISQLSRPRSRSQFYGLKSPRAPRLKFPFPDH